jgi:hypothetical protein
LFLAQSSLLSEVAGSITNIHETEEIERRAEKNDLYMSY